MNADPWDLPGPAAFMDDVLGAIREGANLILQFPEHRLSGFREAARGSIRAVGELSFRNAEAPGVAGGPLGVVAQALGWDGSEAFVQSANALAKSKRLAGSLCWVTGVSSADWPLWRDFLRQFAFASREHTAGSCGQFCIDLIGAMPVEAFANDPMLRCVPWRDRMSRIDGMLHLGKLWSRKGRPQPERDLRVAIATELAGYDLEFAERLADSPLTILLTPHEMLRQEAARRGWTGRMKANAWLSGRSDRWEGRSFEHPASLAADAERDEIDRRIWRAELGVIFPVLEERRIDIVRKMKHFLRPMHTEYGYVDRIEDLEIGSILHQIRTSRQGKEWEARLAHMNELRRALAHLEPVNAENLVGAGLIDPAVMARKGLAA